MAAVSSDVKTGACAVWGKHTGSEFRSCRAWPATCATRGVASGYTRLSSALAVHGVWGVGCERGVRSTVDAQTSPNPHPRTGPSLLSREEWAHRRRRCTGRSVRLRHLATPKRTEDVRSGVLLLLQHWEKRGARSDERAMVAATGAPARVREGDARTRAATPCVCRGAKGWSGNSRELDGRVWKESSESRALSRGKTIFHVW